MDEKLVREIAAHAAKVTVGDVGAIVGSNLILVSLQVEVGRALKSLVRDEIHVACRRMGAQERIVRFI